MKLIDDSGGSVVEVEAEVDEPKGAPSGVAVLLTHGAGGSLATPGLKTLAAELASLGHLTVRFDMTYRALGRRSPPKAEKAAAGYASVLGSARSSLGPDLIWVAGGRSYGGRVASLAAADGMGVAGLLLYSYPLHKPGDPSQPRTGHFQRLTMSAMFLQGTHDAFCDLEVLKQHLPAIRGGHRLEVVAGGEHGLRVTGSRAPDAKPRSEKEVLASLAEPIHSWLSTLR